MANLHHVPCPCAVDSRRLSFDNQIHRRNNWIQFFAGRAEWLEVPTYRRYEQAAQQIAHRIVQPPLHLVYLLDVVRFFPSLKILLATIYEFVSMTKNSWKKTL